MRRTEVKKRIASFLSVMLGTLCLFSAVSFAAEEGAETASSGGGYAASGQLENTGYTSVLYDATNGLPTSDANFVLGADDGYIWIGGYSGIIRYDGSAFERLDTADGLTSGRGLFQDSKGRIWVATNDNGVVVIEGSKRTHLTYREGLPSSSIRIFAEGQNGDIYIGTTAGVCYADENMELHIISDDRLNEERVLKLESDAEGRIYGHTSNGIVFAIDDHNVSEIYDGAGLGTGKITTILADPLNAGNLYFGTEEGTLYYGKFGENAGEMECISVAPIDNTHWLCYACGRVWAASTSVAGYIEDRRFTVLDDIPMNSSIEMMTSDYQGNMWFASSTQGVMKLVTSNFVDYSKLAGLKEEVINAVCIHNDRIYIGTDYGLHILDTDKKTIKDELTEYIGTSRIRCINTDNEGNLWVAVFNNDKGLVCRSCDGNISAFTTENGLPSNEIRNCITKKDGAVIAGTNGGIAIIRNGAVERTIGAKDGIKNTVILTVEEGDDGEIYAGSDGDGIYVIDGDSIKRLGRDEGLTSDVILRIKRDDKNGVYWIVTSNSIQYMKDGIIREVTTFPYNNNYDLYFDNEDNAWILSSCGVYKIAADDLLWDDVRDYKLYTGANGLSSIPTGNAYSTLTDDGSLYISGRSGVCMINVYNSRENDSEVRTALKSVYCGDKPVLPDDNGIYNIPASGERIKISASVLDYTMMNPKVKVFIEGKEEDGIESTISALTPLEYTDLKYGNYILHVQVLDNDGREVADDVYRMVKRSRFTELPIFTFLMVVAIALLAGGAVWYIVKNTVIMRQYGEIRKAKDEADKANTAKTRFLANMSHEIRTPINIIVGMNEMMMREDATGVPKSYHTSMMNYASDVKNTSEYLSSLINDLLDMSKLESGKTQLVRDEYDTLEMLRTIVAMIRIKSAEKNLDFNVEIDEVLPSCLYGDSEKIKQVLLNLLTNSVKYTNVGGVTLRVSLEERRDDICRLRFSVKDTGMGMKKKEAENVFVTYESLDEEKYSGALGTGLGLDISKRFVDLMGGTLTFKSKYGKGTEFVLMLEQKIVDKTPIGAFTEHDESRAKGPYVPKFIAPDADILVVDDTPADLSVIKGLLRPTKVFVSTASSAVECLDKIKDTRFDVVFIDHMLQEMEGVDIVQKIRKKYPDLPVYVITANSMVDETFYISKGFNGYLSKPIDSDLLERTIMKHLPDEIMDKPGEKE